ncbi:MAG: glycogen debranching N-terminal domain-containing protein, partial [Thermoprotei archaeon]
MSNGEVTGEPPTGVYFGDTRIIRSLEYTLDSQRVLPNTVRKVDFSLVYKYDTPWGGFTRRVEVGYGGLIERVNPAPANL